MITVGESIAHQRARLETPSRPKAEATAATLCEQLLWTCRHPFAAKRGLRFLDRRERASWHSWHEVGARSAAVAQALQREGIGAGDVVALVFPTGIAFFEAFFGVLLTGAVPAPIYPPVRLGKIAEYDARSAAMLEAAGARCLLTDGVVSRLLGGLLARLPSLRRLMLTDLASAAGDHAVRPPEADCELLERLAVLGGGVSAEHLGLIQFSSGTTGAPKPVALTHAALLHQADLLASHWPDEAGAPGAAGVGADPRATESAAPQVHSGLSWLPLYHDMGLIGCVLPALQRPADLTLLGPELFVARPALWLRALSRYRATVSPAPNFAYALCTERVRDEELEGCDLSSWRAALNGAETVEARTLEAFARRFARWGLRREALTPVYGLAEAALAVTFSPLDRPYSTKRYGRESLAQGRPEPVSSGQLDTELVSLGRPIPGFAVEVRGDAGEVLPWRHVGHLWIRGPSLMTGYLGYADATRRALRDGWLDTGDLAFVDTLDGSAESAQLFLAGRAKDVLILNGRNHPPEPAEAVIGEVSGVRRGCVVAVSASEEGAASEALWILAELRRGGRPPRAEIVERCRRELLSRLGLRAEKVLLFEPGELPRTSSGKLRRQEALRRLRRGELRPTEGRTLRRRLEDRPVVQTARALWHASRSKGEPRAGEEGAHEADGPPRERLER